MAAAAAEAPTAIAAPAIAAAAPASAQHVITQLLTAIDTEDVDAAHGAISVVEDTPDAHVNQTVRWELGGGAVPISAIVLATLKNLPEIVELLLEHGADPTLKPRTYGWTPFIQAIERGYAGVAQVLLDSGLVDIDQPAGEGAPAALAYAISGDHPVEMAPWLIARGANVNQVDKYGWTPLHRAACKELGPVCELLIDAGADPEAQTRWGKTPREQQVPEGSEIAVMLDPVNLEKRRVWRLGQRVANRSRVLEMIDLFTGRELEESAGQQQPHITLYLTTFRNESIPDVISTLKQLAGTGALKQCAGVVMSDAAVSGEYVLWGVDRDGPGKAGMACMQFMSDTVVNATMQYIVENQPIPPWVQKLPEPERTEKINLIKKYGSPNVFQGFQPHITLAGDPEPELDNLEHALAQAKVNNSWHALPFTTLGVGTVGPYGSVILGHDHADISLVQ